MGWGTNPPDALALGVRFELASRGEEEVLLEPTPSEDGNEAASGLERRRVAIYDRFASTRTARFPAAYLIPSRFPEAIELLLRHGIVVERLEENWRGEVTTFKITELVTRKGAFQGHHLQRLEGAFQDEEVDVEKGTFLVRTAQPLGILIFHLLEPESLDGIAAWGFLDRDLRQERDYPIKKSWRSPPVGAVGIESR